MSKSDRDKRDAERAARRARRLAQRAEQRAKRKEEQAQSAAERASRLAERVKSRPKRERDLDRSIEDLVDEVADKWSQKAQEWIDQQSSRIFREEDEEDRAEDEYSSAEQSASRASHEAEVARMKAGKATRRAREYGSEDPEEHLEARFEQDDVDEEFDEPSGSDTRRRRSSRRYSNQSYSNQNRTRRSKRKRSRRYAWDSDSWDWGVYIWPGRWRTRAKRRRGNLYRDVRNKKICGVCAGAAEYMGMETWHVRLLAVMGLVFIPTVAFSVYFISYFLMDKKPYYRQVIDRFDDDYREEPSAVRRSERPRDDTKLRPTNKEALRRAKEKFSDIEQRLRRMETHVTSSTFELQRELRKISGEDS